MPYLFTCPHCQTQTLVDDQYSGQTGRCVTCGSTIQVPEFAPQDATRPPKSSSRGDAGRRASRFTPLTRRLIAATIGLIIIGCAAVALHRYGRPLLSSLQTSRARIESLRNIERIAAALNAYAADHGSYPPPRIVGPDGSPMHSWRVLILPYLGEQNLFDQYDLNQPWDSSFNQALIDQIPAVYRAAGGAGAGTEAAYALVTGPGTLFPPALPHGLVSLGPADVADDPAQTLLVVEALASDDGSIGWTQPVDLDVSLMRGMLGTASGREIGGVQADGAAVATVQGRGHLLDQQTPPLIVMALITIAGGEPLADDVLD